MSFELCGVVGSVCTEPFKIAIDKAEFYYQQLYGLHTADLDGIVENDNIALTDGHQTELHGAIQEKDTIINEAKVTIAVAQVHLETAQHQKEEFELDLAESTKRWDSQVAELQAEIERLSVINPTHSRRS
ncbi:uncharacterized protein A4U43_C04F26330 [Asparagus officinalis]|uniref:Uncharacterized protein n=1 Tax=Asparagus officinalis TaxID=4686 RepID=A0A5P1F3Q9_ASPOF|nr:uncharacterized protein A4U43_C04F26330 [Asparagus officinalis]